jgi:hypothetical protein
MQPGDLACVMAAPGHFVPGVVPAIHVLKSQRSIKSWMPGTRPGMMRWPNR